MAVRVEMSPVAPELDRESRVTRFGMVALSTDLTSERDAAKVLPQDRAALHVARVAFTNPTTPENLRRMGPSLTGAANLLVPDVPLAAICYACTSASVVLGDAPVEAAISRARPGVPVVTPPAAAVAGFAAMGVGRIALVTPYLPETTAPMAAYFEAAGLVVDRAQCLGLADDREIALVRSDCIRAAIAAADGPGVEGFFISCTALPALGLLAGIEADLGKPVVSSNQAALWRMLCHAGMAPAPGKWGRLLETAPLPEGGAAGQHRTEPA